MSDIDRTATCAKCRNPIEHYMGTPGSEWNTPFWRHASSRPQPHGAVPDPTTVREVTR